MEILSLFDGMSCGYLAMLKAEVPIDRYVAYEIDKYAIETSKHNFPDIEHRGDVFDADFTEFEDFDFLIGGSPCTYWSIAQSPDKRETTASGMGWELFSQYVRALNETKPKYFIYENNKSMSKEIRQSISDTFGLEPIMIDSALVSAQSRKRLYWVGKRNADGGYSKVNVELPEDRGILLKDILDNGLAFEEKSFCVTTGQNRGYIEDTLSRRRRSMAAVPCCIAQRGRYKDNSNETEQQFEIRGQKTNTLTTVQKDNLIAEPLRVGTMPMSDGSIKQNRQWRIYSDKAKSITLMSNGGGGGAKTGLYALPMLQVKEATEQGCADIELGDCFDYGMPNSKTRRGRLMKEKSNCLTTSNDFYQYFAYAVEFNEQGKPTKAVSLSDGKDYSVYKVQNGKIKIKDKQYPIKLVDGLYIIRKLTVRECMKLQTVPEWYEFPVSDTQAYKMLGNGWTVDVITHLIQSALTGNVEPEQMKLF